MTAVVAPGRGVHDHPRDFRSEVRWLSSGFLLMLYSGFGQTYFIGPNSTERPTSARFRATTTAAVVLSTALAPGLVGVLLDAGVMFETQLVVMALYCFLSAAWMIALIPKLDGLASG